MSASKQIDKLIAGLTDWRGRTMANLRKVINDADSKLTEEFKWNTAVWSAEGNVCALGAFKDHIKINFFKGASLPDPHHLFNSGLDAKTSRAINLHEGDAIDVSHLTALVRAAVAHKSAGKQQTR
jgi:hypothetical protein